MPQQADSSARILVPLALVLVAIAFLGVILTSDGDNGGGSENSPAEQRRSSSGSKKKAQPRTKAASYTVKTGDTLAGIADKAGVSVEQLQELNPQLDPQALVSGQKIKLR